MAKSVKKIIPKTRGREKIKNPISRKMEILSKVEIDCLKLIKRAVDGDTDAFIKIMDSRFE